MKRFLETGKIVSTHGLKGELRVELWCDGAEFLSGFNIVYLEKEGTRPVKLLSVRPQGLVAVVRLEGVDTIEQAAALRGRIIYIDRKDAPMDKGEFFVQDLVGLTIKDADSGTIYGELTQVSYTGANDVYHILFADGKERLIPAIKPVVISVDIPGGVMLIRPLEGLFDI